MGGLKPYKFLVFGKGNKIRWLSLICPVYVFTSACVSRCMKDLTRLARFMVQGRTLLFLQDPHHILSSRLRILVRYMNLRS